MTDSQGPAKEGWRGRFFEDFEIGDIYRYPHGRTVTELDNSLFTHITLNTNPLHFDSQYARKSRWGRILVNSTFTLALVTGMSTTDVSQNAMANLGWEKVRLPNPVFIGDTLYCQSEVPGQEGLQVPPRGRDRHRPFPRRQSGRQGGDRPDPAGHGVPARPFPETGGVSHDPVNQRARGMHLMRSWLFVPGNRSRMIQKAPSLGADVIVYDLEDALPSAEKASGRRLVAEALEAPPGRSLRYVRVEADPQAGLEDARSVVRPGLDGLVLPKVSDVSHLQQTSAALGALEAQAGMKPGGVRILAMIESVRGLLAAPAIAAACPRMVGLFFGAEDFTLDLGVFASEDEGPDEMLYARSAVAVAAASRGLVAVDRIVPEFQTLEPLAADSKRARQLGFGGKGIIHPRQIACVHQAFTPSEKQVEKARQVIQRFEQAHREGVGAVQVEGKMVDWPIVEKARRLLRMAEASKSEKPE